MPMPGDLASDVPDKNYNTRSLHEDRLEAAESAAFLKKVYGDDVPDNHFEHFSNPDPVLEHEP